MMKRNFPSIVLCVGTMSLGWALFPGVCQLLAADPTGTGTIPAVANATAVQPQITELRGKALEYLRTKGQAPDGSFSKAAGSGVTSFCTAAMLRSGLSADDPTVAKSLKFLESNIQPDGGIYVADSLNKNYETALAVMALAAANSDGRYKSQIAAADKFLKGLQWDETENADQANVNYGGAGYGRKNRPDLSNTSFLIDALRAAGNGPEDENIQKALIFVSRCQNLESEHNTTPFAAKINDGGFYYTVANGGESFAAGSTPEGGLRSYASMTYAGLKSMVYAGLTKDDPRVKAALAWIEKHYDLDSNPGMGPDGLFYYYHTFAKTLHALEMDTVTDAQGVKHDWRAELVAQLAKRQQADGSWVGDSKRWMETDPNLVTAYGLMCLAYAEKPASK
ncbi:MAG: prenyltransferase/squalene oxidase repeat-containing protein [Pirellulales bacterium]|nr:prenyltransferase/squalene oxidase repeat-containing protein [Pirellulales bacterium]